MERSSILKLFCGAGLTAASFDHAGAQGQPAAPAPHHLSFAVAQDLAIDANPATILAIVEQPKLWSQHLVRHDHVGGPLTGVGADYEVETRPAGAAAMTRRERTIVADDRRIVLRILTGAPNKGVTFAEIATTPQGAATRTSFKIFLDVETADEVPASMIPAMVQQNEAILAGHLQRIKALAETR